MLVYLYRRRLRVHALQELLAGVGVAVAVALVFAVLVANSSISGSAGEVIHTIVGPASLQLRARTEDGFDERLLARVEQLAGVAQSAPVLEQSAELLGPHGRHITVTIAGADVSLAVLDGLAHTIPLRTLSSDQIALTKTSAARIGISHGGGASTVSLDLRGASYSLRVATVLGRSSVGALSQAQVAIMPLARLQRLAGLPGRITRILVQTKPGHQAQVRGELRTLAGGHLDVEPAGEDLALLRQALRAGDQASDFFAAIAVLLGFLFAFNAMLLTIPEQRRAITDLRLLGTHRSAIVRMVLFQALCLGLVASLAGLLAGYALSLGVFHQSPGYLARAFTLGTHTVVGLRPLLLSLICGLLATCLATTVLLLDVRRGPALDSAQREDGTPGQPLGRRTARRRLALVVGLLLALTTAGYVFLPGFALVVSFGLALTCILAVPLLFDLLLGCTDALVRHGDGRLSTLALALSSLRSVTLRSLVLAATGAVALFGSLALGGARVDLLHGIEGFAHGYVTGAAVWIDTPADYQGVNDFRGEQDSARIAHLPGVAGVRSFQGGFLQMGGRRVWITVRPADSSGAILRSQIIEGDPATAVKRLSAGGWIVVSEQIATERHLKIGQTLTLPTPTGPAGFRIAALSTNFGWSPGMVLMSPADYQRAWQTTAPTALGVTLTAGASATSVRSSIERELGPGSGLQILTARARESEIDASVSEGLSRLSDISSLLVLAAILALAAALASSIHQRRALLCELRLAGARPQRLARILFLETALTLSAGALTGALAGLYGQALIDSYLRHVTGFPVSSITATPRPLEILALVVVAVLAIVAIPARRASRVSPTLALGK
ncbi:MAG TPA: FtsX-like permease family protein [Solirubrobacteraceae bacterium]